MVLDETPETLPECHACQFSYWAGRKDALVCGCPYSPAHLLRVKDMERCGAFIREPGADG